MKKNNLSCWIFLVPADVQQGNALPCFSCHTVNKCPFLSLFSATFSHFCVFGDFTVSNGSQEKTEVLSSVSNCKKTVWPYVEKRVLDNLCSGMCCWPWVPC